jgi:hypothetical protein
MPEIANPGQIAAKWSRRASSAGGEFEEGVSQSSDQEWEEGTADAEDAWATGVQNAASEGRFESGVRNSTKSWQERTMTLGTQRYTRGVNESQSEYQQGFAPYASVIENTNLPARGARGDSQNYQRAEAMGRALHDAKTSR